MERVSVQKGKQAELVILGKLLERGLMVYTPVADVEGIDFIIHGKNNQFFEVQVKSRDSIEDGETVWVYPFEPNSKRFLIIYSMKSGKFWIIPSKIYHRYCMKGTATKRGKKWQYWRLNVRKYLGKLIKYEDERGIDNLVNIVNG